MAERLLIADPRFVVRAGLRAVCLGNGLVDVEESADYDGLAATLADERFAVAIVQVVWAGRDAFPAIDAALRINPKSRVIALYDDATPTRRLRSLIYGACEELNLDSGSQDAAAKIKAVSALAQSQPTGELGAYFRELQTLPERPSACADLSRREFETLRYLSGGLSNAEIARIMRIGLPTLKEHLGGVLRKMNFQDRVQAAVRGAMLRLLPE